MWLCGNKASISWFPSRCCADSKVFHNIRSAKRKSSASILRTSFHLYRTLGPHRVCPLNLTTNWIHTQRFQRTKAAVRVELNGNILLFWVLCVQRSFCLPARATRWVSRRGTSSLVPSCPLCYRRQCRPLLLATHSKLVPINVSLFGCHHS